MTLQSIDLLCVSASPTVATEVETHLDRTGTEVSVETAASTQAGQALFTHGQFDCVIADYDLPESTGLDFFTVLRREDPAIPFILLVEPGAETIATRAAEAGVTDYLQLTGSEDYERLATRIRTAVGTGDPIRQPSGTDRLLEELTAASKDVHWLVTADWDEVLFVNDAYERIWGQAVDALDENARDFLDGVHPEDRERVQTAMETLSGGESVDIEFRVNAAEDYRRRVWVQGEPIRDEAGDVVRVAGFARDVTDRVERRRETERAEARFRTLAENFPNGGVHYFDTDLRYQYVSGSGFEHIDTSPEDLVGNTIYEVDPYTEAEVETLESLMEATLDGETQTREIPYEGHVYEVHSVPLCDDTGAVTGGFFIAQDITERRERQRKLEARSAAIEASIDGIAILDDDETYRFVNQAHADVYGYDDPDAFLGNSWRMCYGESERERFETEVMPTLFETGQWRGEAVGTRADGSTFPQELSLSVTDDGRVICVARDVSERKHRERELARQNERLEEFTSVVSHDLRGPLSVASGRLELAREECDSEHLDEVEESVERAGELVEELHTLAREGEPVGEVETVDFEKVVREAWETVETGDATLTVDDSGQFCADRSRARQLFENLFRNAVEHGSTNARSQASEEAVEHGDAVTVRVGWTGTGFYVADDGRGIPSAERDRVFETGYSTATSGTGYGLNIVSEIVAAHDWEISVSESESGGARFDVTGVTTPPR